MSYPDTVMACVTAHGGIDVTAHGELLEHYLVPEGVKIIKLSAVSPGICNMVTEEESESFIEEIFKFIRGSKGRKPRKKFTRETVEKLAAHFHKLDEATDNIEGCRRQGLDSRTEGVPDPLIEDYFHHADTKYVVQEYSGGDEILNKVYVRNNRELALSPFDLKINLMNVVGVPDLVEKITGKKTGLRPRPGAEDSSEIHLNHAINYLTDRGVTTIVLVDLSCSFFGVQGTDFTKPSAETEAASTGRKTPGKKSRRKRTPSPEEESPSSEEEAATELTPRTSRRLRKELKAKGLYGGKKLNKKMNKRNTKRRMRRN
jgi:hypothetical protein